MSRLIDADAFADFIRDAIKRQKYEDLKNDGLLTVADVLEAVISDLDGTSIEGYKNAPTIEPQRMRGRWIGCGNSDHWKCSVCGIRAAFWFNEESSCGEWELDMSEWLSDFCPNCGSYNGGEQDE